MRKPNAFEQAHAAELKTAETAALKTLKEIVDNKSTSSADTDAVRVEAARIILSIRSDDA